MKKEGIESYWYYKSHFLLNRAYLFIPTVMMVLLIYLNWAWLLQKQQEIGIQKNLSESLQALLNRDLNSDFEPKLEQITESTTEDFSVADRGYWKGLGSVKGHMFDGYLALALLKFLKTENVKTLLELGAGTGEYARVIKNAGGIIISCYDGNPSTQELSKGLCAIIDLSKPIEFCIHDWTLSLEVGEHIPKQFEDIFISNLVQGNRHGIILSWAVKGQGGWAHVNTRNNSYIRNKILSKGYTLDFEAEKLLRAAARFSWFKKTIMVFRKK